MQKHIILTSILAAAIVTPSLAEVTAADRKTVTSRGYVDTQFGTKQGKIPTAGTNASNTGTSVVMYTGTAGTVGERGIYSGTSYTASEANKLVTASSLNGTVEALPSISTSKLECANGPTCTLWTITDQNVLGRQGTQGD